MPYKQLDIFHAYVMDDKIVLSIWDTMPNSFFTRRAIASALGRKVTPSLIQRIERLTNEGLLICERFELPNRARGYRYIKAQHEQQR